jgi:hypothetical protein
MAKSTTEAPVAREFPVLTLMVIMILAVWSVSVAGTVVLYRKAMAAEQSMAATPDSPPEPQSGAGPPLQVAAE